MTRSGLTGDEIAEKLTALVGQRVSKQQLDQWTSENKRRLRFPLAFAAAFGELTGSSYDLARFVLGPHFSFLLAEEQGLRALIRAVCLAQRLESKRGSGKGRRP